jgi:hypothetical protein
MNWLKRGPELKLPDVWVPKFLEDLYFDLKDRRLLPVVALALVALVAVPILLSGGSKESSSEPAVPPVAAAASGGTADNASLTVVRANPGLRDYRKRLRGRKPTDPFKQRFTAPELKGAKLGSKGNNGFEASPEAQASTSTSTMITATDESETVKITRNENGVVKTSTETHVPSGPSGGKSPESTPTKTTETTTTVPTEPKGSGESAGAGETKSPEASATTYAVEVRVEKTVPTATGGTEDKAPVVKKVVASPTPLPGEKDQVLTYVGIDGKTSAPMFLVSDEVNSAYGEAKCLAGKSECRLLSLEVGMPITLVVGPGQVRYKFTLVSAEAVTTAPFSSGATK